MKSGNILPALVTVLASVTGVVNAAACRARPHSSLAPNPNTSASQVDPVSNPTSPATFPPKETPTIPAAVVVSSPASTPIAAPLQTLATSVRVIVQPAPSKVASVAAPHQTSPAKVFTGLGTRYGLSDGCTEEDCWQSGACSFVGYDLPSGLDGSTCVSEDIWADGANCGGCISVTYKGVTLKIMVTNKTGGDSTHLDMTPSTWSKLTKGYSGGGVDGIEWQWITCPLPESSPLQIHMHAGASKYWFAATVENARLRTAKVEVSSDQGNTWKNCPLHDPNMYILDGTLPSDTAYVRVTDVEGNTSVVKDVVLKSGFITKAT